MLELEMMAQKVKSHTIQVQLLILYLQKEEVVVGVVLGEMVDQEAEEMLGVQVGVQSAQISLLWHLETMEEILMDHLQILVVATTSAM